MPSALSSQNDYYARHHRRQSSMSQPDLPDQLKDSLAAAYSPSRSAVFLPSTIYTSSSEDRPLSPPSINISHVSAQVAHSQKVNNDIQKSSDPDEYYRRYQMQYSQPTGGGLQQQGVAQTDQNERAPRHFVITSSMPSEEAYTSSTQRQQQQRQSESPENIDSSTLQRNQPVSRARKSSVKNLVAQINATSADEMPPLPNKTISQPVSRSISPVLHFNTAVPPLLDHNSTGVSDVRHDTNYTDQRGLGLMVQTSDADGRMTHRKPLFGEVVSHSPASVTPGFGIVHLRKRSGSEGSPLMSGPADFSNDSRTITNSSITDRQDHSSERISSTTVSQHRRVLSDSPVTPTGNYHLSDPFVIDPFGQPGIPVQHVLNNPSPIASRSETKLNTAISRSSPRRRRRASEIQSPGKSRRNETTAVHPQNSSSLQASIIAPPPKVSPPLRSSRPRLPVSSASTAASRARMAEKFTTMQKLHNDKRALDKRPLRPPELSDIDLKARRLRITQALSRSLEGQELRGLSDVRRRGTSSSRTASPSYSERSYQADRQEHPEDLPTITVHTNKTLSNDVGLQHSHTGTESNRHYTQNALHAMSRSTLRIDNDDDDDDSPTLGRGDTVSNKPSPLQTHFLHVRNEDEPSSAATADTDHTTIDPEPQTNLYPADVSSNKVLDAKNSSVQRQMSRSMRSESYDDLSDRGDLESVHLVLRDTTYLDDSEAIRTGYRTAQNNNEPVPSIPISLRPESGSWSSSAQEYRTPEHEVSRLDSSSVGSDDLNAEGVDVHVGHTPGQERSDPHKELNRSMIDSDAYMIVNIVLQQHSSNGVVDQQFVDDVYSRILQTSPYKGETLDTNKIEQMCLRELQERENNWRKSIIGTRNIAHQAIESTSSPVDMPQMNGPGLAMIREAQPRYQDRTSETLSPPFAKSHHYKSSLDSAEDWADTSPSVGDWMRFAVADEARRSMSKQASSLRTETQASEVTLADAQPQTDEDLVPKDEQVQDEDPEMYAGPSGFASPPPPAPPAKDTPFVEQKLFGALVEPPTVPQRLTSLTQLGDQTPPVSQSPAPGAKTPAEDPEIIEQRQLKKRWHIMKELVDTEVTYEKDLRVLCDIYKQTASAALTEDDIKVLFGNVEEIQDFSEEFLTSLKSAAKPAYVMDRRDSKKDKAVDEPVEGRPESLSSTLASISSSDGELPSPEKDRETRLGQAFELIFGRMEKTYAEYIRNRQAANTRLEIIQKSSAAREWLKVCRNNSSDITNAWNLDALLVKPVQRITKYPLLLRELVESTPADHPDAVSLKHALHEITEINIRINDVKKQTELVDQALSRKRKDSEVRLGLSKAFGRRAEKLKQHLGTAEMYEDNDYNDIKIDYDNNIVHLMVVGHDCSSYGRAITKWVTKIVEIATAAEAWLEVSATGSPEAESKLRQFAMIARGISTIALPDHLEHLETKVLNPMQSGVDLMNRFKNDQKSMLQKRDKRLIDYAQARNRKDKGEKIDRKMAERMEQWEALNTEAKQRMKKLIKATGVLVQHCRRNLLEMQMSWMKMIQTSLATTIGVNLEKLEKEDIQKEWQMDFDPYEARIQALGICNGSLLAEAVNMMSFNTPSTTLNGDDSPRHASFNSQHKRSISLHSNGSHTQLMDSLTRNSGASNRQHLEVTGDRNNTLGSAFHLNRERTSSFTAAAPNRTSDASSKNAVLKRASANRNDERSSGGAPRLSVDTPSPLIGSLSPVATKRPPSWSTFFSAATEIPSNSRHKSNGSSVFSSAMPMPDSPTLERNQEQPPESPRDPQVLFTAASVYEFNIDRSRKEGGFPYLTYVTGEIFDVIGYNGELWLARNQDDAQRQVGWIWNKHFAKLAE